MHYVVESSRALPVLTQLNESTVLGVLFALQGTLVITSLCSIPVFVLAHVIPRVSLDIWLVAYICFTLCVHYSWMRVSLIVRLVSFEVNALKPLMR